MSMHTILMGAKTLYFVDYNELTWFISAPFWMDVGEEKKISLGPCPQFKTYPMGHSTNTKQSCGFFIFTSSSMIITLLLSKFWPWE